MSVCRINMLLLSFLLFISVQAKSFEVDGVKYGVIDKSDNVSIKGASRGGVIYIPEEVSDGKYKYRVTEVSAKAFEKFNTPFDLRLPVSVTKIGEKAFLGSSLSSIDMTGVINIGKKAFSECARLKDIIIPASVKSIGDGAFDSTHLVNLGIGDSDEILELGTAADGGKGMFADGVENLYVGRALGFTKFPFDGETPSIMKRFMKREDISFKWEGKYPRIIPAKSRERLVTKSYFQDKDWVQLYSVIDVEAEKALKQEYARREAEKTKAEEEKKLAAIRKREREINDILRAMDSADGRQFYTRTANGYSITFSPEIRLFMHDGDYSNPFDGVLHEPTRTVKITLTPTTLTVTDTEEIQITCPFNPKTGQPTRPSDPYKDAFECSTAPEHCKIKPGGIEMPFTKTCTHSMYKTKIGPYAPWRVKHTFKATYNLASIAVKNKTSIKNVLQAWVNLAFKKDFIPIYIFEENGKVNGLTISLPGDPDEMSYRTAWIYILEKTMAICK